MICEIAGYERKRSVRTKNQEKEAGLRTSASLISLCLDTDGKEGESGKLYHLCDEHPITFSSLFRAVNQMEELYNACLFPQACAGLRSFPGDRRTEKPVSEASSDESLPEPNEVRETGMLRQLLQRRGAKATFWIRVMYCQHASWQGEVTWVEQQKKEYFRSTLELLHLIDSALCAEDTRNVRGKI